MQGLNPSRAFKSPLPSGSCAVPSTTLGSQRCFHATPLAHRGKPKGVNPKFKLDSKLAARARSNAVSSGHDPKSRLRQSLKSPQGSHATFKNTILSLFPKVLDELLHSEFSLIGVGEDELNRQAVLFMNAIDDAFIMADRRITRRDANPLFSNLKDAFIYKDVKGLTKEIRYAFQSFLLRFRFTKALESNQQKLLDFRFPQEWLPATRSMQRTIHVHVGPTNSGKTYNALKALENSKEGIYAGPLRLLANEVYQRLTAKGLPCALMTGEEVRLPENTDRYFVSCTVEMMPQNKVYDVAVIDEIQMVADPERGNAWSLALLGIQAKEVHVCGEERTVEVLQSICASIGDKCIIHRYERLSPLETSLDSINDDYSRLQKGDAIVSFSRVSLHAMKRNIERATGRRCAIIYGGLPPEVRASQAALFNDQTNDYDFVVASDAIGMGLNLEIRRVIFETITKHDGTQNRTLNDPEIKQIGGRAGRYRTATNPDGSTVDGSRPNVGLVTTMDRTDLRIVSKAFENQIKPIDVAYIEPPLAIVERFATYYPPGTPLSFILTRITQSAIVSNVWRIGVNQGMLDVADVLQDIPLRLQDRLCFIRAPVKTRNPESMKVLRGLARMVAENDCRPLVDIPEMPFEVLELDTANATANGVKLLGQLETIHDATLLYLWLSYRFTGIFRDQALAFHVRSLVEERLVDLLERLDFTDTDMSRWRRQGRREALSRDQRLAALGISEDADEELGPAEGHMMDDAGISGMPDAPEAEAIMEVDAVPTPPKRKKHHMRA